MKVFIMNGSADAAAIVWWVYKKKPQICEISQLENITLTLYNGVFYVSLFIAVILFSISSLCKYVPHILLGFLPEHTQETTSFEDLT